MDKKVSIIMPVYNVEHTLVEAIDSIIHQTYSNWQLVICDDASTDDTYKIAKKYADQYPEKIILLRNKVNSKIRVTLNHCLQYADGSYIARMDGDDISLPTRLEKQIAFLEKNPKYIVCGCAMIPFDDEREYAPRIMKNCEDVNQKRMCFHATLVCRREMYERLGGYCEKWYTNRCEDQYLWYSLSSHKDMFTYNLKEPLYKVREDRNTYSRRNIKNALTTSACLFVCYRKMHFPLRKYIHVLRPFVSAILPYKVMKKYHSRKSSGEVRE